MNEEIIYYTKYARLFWDKINSNFSIRVPEHNYLPIVFEKLPLDKKLADTYGYTHIHINDKTGKASLFPVVFLRDDCARQQIEETIRHEIIHYYLGLHYVNHQDNSALFTLMCYLLDGGAYVELDERRSQILDIVKPYAERIFTKYESSDDKQNIILHLSLILTAVDDMETHVDKDLKKLAAACKVCCNKCDC